jgi:murein DD-endopeptidase MepM/ murein hydrolase activator NlpD
MNATQDTLDHRAWVAYENGPGSNLEFILGSTSLADLTDRLEIVNHVAKSDADLIAEIANERNLLQANQQSLQQQEDRLQAQKSDLSSKQTALNLKLVSAQSVVAQFNRDKAAAQRQVRKLQAQRRREIAAALAAASLGGGGGGPSIPGVLLLCPVDQPHAYADDFGAPRPGHRHRGNDIVAPMGTPIRAPFDGNAVDSWDP